MPPLSTLRNYAAFGKAIPGFVRQRVSLESARALVQSRFETRDQRFLQMMKSHVFGYANSPYLPLLRAAGCEFSDIEAMVNKDGLEPTVRHLREEGVYFSFEEFKGREPVVRRGVSFEVRPEQFDNPFSAKHIQTRTGGTTGPSTRGWMSLDRMRGAAEIHMLELLAHGLLGVPNASWHSSEPSVYASFLPTAQAGTIPEVVFAPRGRRRLADSFSHGLGWRLIVLSARFGGARIPGPTWIDASDSMPVARWARKKLDAGGGCVVHTLVSGAVRLASTATENGISLEGAAIIGTGEPATPAKVRRIKESGARWIPVYWFTDGGGKAGFGCANPADGTDVHLKSHRLLLIQHPRQVPGSSLSVDAFNFTTLGALTSKILINVEMDDYGIVEQRHCGCFQEELGWDQHLREIYSFRKLTGEGATLVGSDMIRILEEVLPQKFGGNPLDYQLIEEEDEKNLTRMSLVIHPRLRVDDEQLVVKTVLEELSSSDAMASMAGTIWAQSGTFRIKRMEPVSTWRGKLLPLHIARERTRP